MTGSNPIFVQLRSFATIKSITEDVVEFLEVTLLDEEGKPEGSPLYFAKKDLPDQQFFTKNEQVFSTKVEGNPDPIFFINILVDFTPELFEKYALIPAVKNGVIDNPPTGAPGDKIRISPPPGLKRQPDPQLNG